MYYFNYILYDNLIGNCYGSLATAERADTTTDCENIALKCATLHLAPYLEVSGI